MEGYLTEKQWTTLRRWCRENEKRIHLQGLQAALRIARAGHPSKADAEAGWTACRRVRPTYANLREICRDAPDDPISKTNPVVESAKT